jgi:hypothetical protein
MTFALRVDGNEKLSLIIYAPVHNKIAGAEIVILREPFFRRKKATEESRLCFNAATVRRASQGEILHFAALRSE